MAMEIEQILEDAIGLEASSLGRDAVEQAVAVRQKECRIRCIEEYLLRLRQSPVELQALIEAVVVGETWFFRNPEAFQALTDWARAEWLQSHSGVLRILSLPCSTGEEPYSIAMSLLDCGFPPDRFRVDAIDINRRSLDHAGRAVYRQNSFRSADLSFRARHFSERRGEYELSASVRERVRFQYGNLHAPDFMADAEPYHVIFCRNLLIYFDAGRQRYTTTVLKRLLACSGVLFAGPAEGIIMIEAGFAPMKERMSFGFQRRHSSKPPIRITAPRRRQEPPVRPSAKPVSLPAAREVSVPRVPEAVPDISVARRFADAGQLQEAQAVCEQLLKGANTSAEAFSLMGIIQDALNQPQLAKASFNRALYLNPNHFQALAHLAMINERSGDAAGAKRLRERARRAEDAAKEVVTHER